MTNIDYGNRLPRGSTYARNGSVKKISIERNTIRAKVQGSRPKPYDVTVIVPPFFAPEIRLLIKALAEKPAVISKLLNRELDPAILQIAERKGLKVFPRQWTDFKMQCSCPDWATPCKHLAAIIYKLSAEIDNNPFMVFQLHNVDLPKELEKENIHIRQPAGNDEVPLLTDELMLKAKKAKSAKKTVKDDAAPDTAFQSLNFSTLAYIADSLIQLLPDSPAFYSNSGNFRDKYTLALQKAVRNAQRIIIGKAALRDFLVENSFIARSRLDYVPGIPYTVTSHDNLQLLVNVNNDVNILVDEKQIDSSPEAFLVALWQVPPELMPDYKPTTAVLRTALLLCVNLVANGAVVPQLVRLGNKQFAIRWLPAMLSKEACSLIDKMGRLLPPEVLLFTSGQPVNNRPVVNLVSVMVSILIRRLSENADHDSFLELFFGGNTFPFDMPGQESLPSGINAWLQRYYLTQGRYKPSLVVEEQGKGKFSLAINIEQKEDPRDPIPLHDVINKLQYQKPRYEILQSMSLLSSFIPGLDDYINSGREENIMMNAAAFAPFLMQAIPAIQLLNINILLPRSLRQILHPRPSVRIKQKQTDGSGFMRFDSLLQFEWQVAVGEHVISQEEFNRLLSTSEGLIRYKTSYIYVSPGELEKLHRHFSSIRDLSPFEMLRAALSDEYQGAKVSLSGEVEALIKQLTAQPDEELPGQLRAQLRPYQHRGYSWMIRNTQIGFGSVLADDMGLGKTLQVIATLLRYKEEGVLQNAKALVVSPTGLLTNWQSECEKFAPTLNCRLYHGLGRKIVDEDYDVLLTSYGVVRSDAAKLKKMPWHVLVIDEAQNIKNYEAAQSKAIKSIPANTYIAMSGTPVENRLSELWSIMDFCNRGFLGSLQEFKQQFAIPIQNQHDTEVAGKLKVITSPFLMRRLKSDKAIISDLPDKIEINSFSHLTREQASLYEKTLQKALQAIEEVKATDHKSLFARQGLVLQMILALKQICNHPTQFLKNKVLDVSLSGKMELLFDKLESILEANEKTLVFSQFTEMGSLLQHFITEKFGEQPLFYHGGCSLTQRKEMVNQFQNNRAHKIFVLSLKAAGTGLNLTAANHVIHYDLWWNPAVEAQATDRAYRIGQKSDVMVHRFITKGTFEERINEMIQNKKALADLTISSGENWIGNLSNRELKNLFTLGGSTL